ncbi:sulfatase-like hydrolase/transferase [Gilvimarinus chinensis]|uniref:sulfatase-like hydrolase/transferase n=1 Tax=Gilvimarinus chinensis TaxID=396005 RepID=UPI000399D82C|nr:sulfatase-like hydrolase/transferase [Gilvimarinus chinensis]
MKSNLTIFLCIVLLIYTRASHALEMENLSSSSGAELLSKPNFLLIQVDDLGYDDLAIHGNRVIETPSLDQLARESVRFENFYVSSVCAPTRASLLTGRHFWRTGVSGVHAGRDFIHLSETLLPELLQENGYATGMWGKWHSGKTQGYMPWDRGFEEAYYATLYNYFDNNGLLNGKEVSTKGFATNVITDMAIDFLARHQDKQFFAYVPYMAPHNPWRAPAEHIAHYQSKGYSYAAASLFGMIDNLDDNIGRLLSALDEYQLADTTVVIFLSDNGPWVKSYRFGLNEEEWNLRNPSQRRGMKSKNWENGIKSPLFVRWGKHYSPEGIQVGASAEDIFPTIMQLAGIDIDPNLNIDGRSLIPALEGREIAEKSVINAWASPLSQTPANNMDTSGFYRPLTESYRKSLKFEQQRLAIRRGNYKFIKNEIKAGDNELFDVIADPKEHRNLVEFKPEIAKSLNKELELWFEEIANEAHAMKMPVFQIGLDGQIVSQILAYAPSDLSRELNNHDHYLANWTKTGLWADYHIEVHTPGEYDVYLMTRMSSHEGKVFSVQVESEETAATLSNAKTRPIGFLLRNESAYWDNFDKYETISKDIKNSYLGKLVINSGENTLRVSLQELMPGANAEKQDQLIALQLVRRE